MDIINCIQEISQIEKIVDCSSNQSVLEQEILKIEQYLSHGMPEETIMVLKRFQGCSFKDNVKFSIKKKIPILVDSRLLDFGIFLTLSNSHYQIYDILVNNEDLFKKRFIPIIEATPGDYIAQDMITMNIYFISHDFKSPQERGRYKIAESLRNYFLNLSISPEDDNPNVKSPIITKVHYSDKLLRIIAKYKKD